MITAQQVLALCPGALPGAVKALVDGYPALVADGTAATPLRWCHFFAQAGHECAGFRRMEESFRYSSAERLHSLYPRAFPTVASAAFALSNPALVAEGMYGGRRDLGNTQAGWGWLYRGRGIFQLTGRFNYVKWGAEVGLPLADKPWLAADPFHALTIARAFWKGGRCAERADRDDLAGITRYLNGGENGLPDRANRLAAAKRMWLRGA